MEKKLCPSCFREFEGSKCPHCGGAQNDEHQLPVGTLLHGRYQIGRVLGQGGFGITYMARDRLLGNTVAVKEFYPGSTVFRRSADSTSVECINKTMIPHYTYSKERFLREAGALVKFRELPEVVDILDFSEENNTAYIVMEFVKGMDLAAYVRNRGGRLTPDETFRILKPVMEALATVHKGGIVHRDISPDNIILEPMGGAKLLDFGAVRAVEDPDVEKGLNKSTEAILKQGFAPIEQYNTRGSLGPWTDEYAMCATVWYCLTGKIPEEASIRMSEGIDPDWSGIEGLPEHQQKALEKGFSCRARDRYMSMDELLEALFPGEERKAEAVPATVPDELVAEPVPTTVKAPGKRKAPKGRRKPLAVAITAVAAVLAVAVLVAVLVPKATETVSEETLPPQTQDTTEQTEITTEPISEEERQYLLAEHLLAEGKFQEAIDIFSALGDYKDSPLRCEYAKAELLLEEGKLGEAAIRFGKLGDHADARARSLAVWDMIAVRETVSGGEYHTVGLRTDGTAVAVGRSYTDQYYKGGRCDVEGWTDIVAVSAGGSHTVGLKADGTVVAVGYNHDGECDVEGWTDIVAVSAGSYHTVGLKADGTVVAVGRNGDGRCGVEGWTDIVAVSAGGSHTVGLKADGTVVAVGYNEYGQCDVEGWTDIVAVSAGGWHTVGLKADGTVVAVGYNYTAWNYKGGRCDVEGWTDIVAVCAGYEHTVGLKADGTVVATGWNNNVQCELGDWTDVSAVAAGYYHTLVLFSDGTLAATGTVYAGGFTVGYGQTDVAGWTDIQVPKPRVPFR